MKNAKVQQIVTRAKSTFDGFTRGQKAVTIIAVVVALVGGIVFYQWASRPQMTTLFSGLSSSDASAITTKLDEKGTKYELGNNGSSILVERQAVDQTRLDLAGEGLPADKEKTQGYGLVENAPMTLSDEQQKILIQRATEGELKNAIEKIDTVEDATVHLALPAPDVFTREQTAPTASVLVKTKPNETLTASQVEAIVHLVGSAVPKLDANAVTVTDSTGKLLSAPGVDGATGMGEARVAQAAAISAQKTQAIQAMLDKLVGPGKSSVTVAADLNWDNVKKVRNDWLPPAAGAVPVQQQKTTENYKNAGQTPVGGVLGPDNIPVPQTNTGNNSGNYQKTEERNINPVGTEQTWTDGSTGGISKLSVSVMLDSKAAAAIQPAMLQQQIVAAAGADLTGRKDQVVVNKFPFDQSAAQALAAQQAAMDAQNKQNELITLAKNIGLALLLLLALLVGFRKSRRKTTTIEVGELTSIEEPLPGDDLPELPGGAHALDPAAIEGPPPAEYELDDDDLPILEATPVDPQSAARATARQEITNLVEENPDEVARLLRGWMAERN